MPIRPLLLSDHPLLRKKSRRVRRIEPTLQRLVDDMVETMHARNGIGLAAVQIGAPERIIVVQLPEDEENPDDSRLYAIVNPELARRSREVEEGVEGCLSVPGWVGDVSRHYAVTVKGLDPRGKPVRIKAEGWLARVFQHEVDHCDGILFIDHITDPDKIRPVPEGEEEAAEAAQGPPGKRTASGSPA